MVELYTIATIFTLLFLFVMYAKRIIERHTDVSANKGLREFQEQLSNIEQVVSESRQSLEKGKEAYEQKYKVNLKPGGGGNDSGGNGTKGNC